MEDGVSRHQAQHDRAPDPPPREHKTVNKADFQQPAYGQERSYSSRQEVSSYSQSSSRYKQTSTSSVHEYSSSPRYPGSNNLSSYGPSNMFGGYGSPSGYGNDSSNAYGSSSGRTEEHDGRTRRRGEVEDEEDGSEDEANEEDGSEDK